MDNKARDQLQFGDDVNPYPNTGIFTMTLRCPTYDHAPYSSLDWVCVYCIINELNRNNWGQSNSPDGITFVLGIALEVFSRLSGQCKLTFYLLT